MQQCQLWELLLAGNEGEEEEAEAAAVAMLHSALASKLGILEATEPLWQPESSGAESRTRTTGTGCAHAAGGASSESVDDRDQDPAPPESLSRPVEVSYVKQYRAGLRDVLTWALAECQEMARMVAAAEDESGDEDEGASEEDSDEDEGASEEDSDEEEEDGGAD